MRAQPEITFDEWRKALAPTAGDEGLTCRELAEALGVCLSTMTRWLNKGIADGKVLRGRAERECCIGMRIVPVYRMVKNAP